MGKNTYSKLEGPNGCTCPICKNTELIRWATISECRCMCHKVEYPVGHDSLCCAYPNGKKKDNPYDDLKPAIEYEKIFNELTK